MIEKVAPEKAVTGKVPPPEKIKVKTKEPEPKDADDELERELEDTFPASDPPSLTQGDLKSGDPERKSGKTK